MKFFLDTEFIEGFHKPLFGKRRHFIDLISIGIVCEDGRSYYAISSEFKERDADPWVRQNVIHPIYKKAAKHPAGFNVFSAEYVKPNWKIAEELQLFVYQSMYNLSMKNHPEQWAFTGSSLSSRHLDNDTFLNMILKNANSPIEFYGYYADYDWVLFCSLFGRMINLPVGFPMYCRDLKQMLDETAATLPDWLPSRENFGSRPTVTSDFAGTFGGKLNYIKKLPGYPGYPKQEDEHNALADAKWNFNLWKFILDKRSDISKLPLVYST